MGAWHRWPAKAPLQLRETDRGGECPPPSQPPATNPGVGGAPPRAAGTAGSSPSRSEGKFWDQGGWWLPNITSVPNATELYAFKWLILY